MSTAPSRKELTHERIVDAAARAIRRAGYDGVGVADIMKDAGLTHGGFYAHFASRDALLVEAMERAGKEGSASLAARMARQRAAGASDFGALVASYLSEAHFDACEQGCPVAALASEMPRQADAVVAAARLRVQALIDLVHNNLPAGADTTSAPAVAAALVGAMQLARTLGGRAGKALLAATRQSLITQYEPGDAH